MWPIVIVVVIVVLLAGVQVRRRTSRLQRADNAPPGRPEDRLDPPG